MKLQKRIGIIMGRIHKTVNKQLLEGILEQAYSKGFSAYVFTLSEEEHNPKLIHGQKNLLTAIQFAQLDGIVFAPYSFSSEDYYTYIGKYLQENCTVPVIRIGIEKEPFLSVWHDDRAEMAEIVTHLIEAHGCRNICCLTGPDNLEVSQSRQAGYRDAMEQAGLPYTEDDIIFGDFWIFSSQHLADEIANGNRKKPDAVVCANDIMAIALCDALKEHGIIVPDDICVTGYDGYTETRLHVPPVTTYETSWKQLGRNAVCRLYREITGEDMPLSGFDKGTLLQRESCGCNSHREKFDAHQFNLPELEKNYIDNNLSAYLHDADSLNGFIDQMYRLTYTFIDKERYQNEQFYLCLCEDWDRTGMEDGKHIYRTEGYSDQMLFISANHERIIFPQSKMLPDVLKKEEPSVTFFTAVHFLERCFGYACFAIKGGIEDFNVHYLRYCCEVNNGLEHLCVQNELKRLAYRKYIAQSRDELTGLYLSTGFSQAWKQTSELAELYCEDIYMAVISIGGLQLVEDTDGVVEKDKLLVSFADKLSRSCTVKEKAFRFHNTSFVVIGSEAAPENHYDALIKDVITRFERQNILSGSPYYLKIKHDLKLVSYTTLCDADKMSSIIEETLQNQAESLQPTPADQALYAKFIALRKEIYQYPERTWHSDSCSQKLNFSSSHFQKKYRSIFNINFMGDVQQSRLNRAKKLLVTTDDTLQIIAEKCGYDYFNFMRTFKKEMGITPTQYRRGKHN